MFADAKIFIAGAHGMVGSALVRAFKQKGACHLLTPRRQELDLLNQASVRHYLQKERPDIVLIAAAKVGGIWANQSYPAEFLYENLTIASHLIHGAHEAGVNRLLFLGSSCIYPRLATQPIKEESLLTGPLEPTNEAYALAKIAGIKLVEFYSKQYGRDYISAMPTNLYGPNDNYHPTHSHVIPGLIRRFYEAATSQQSEVALWGSGKVLREFLYVDDLAAACLFLLEHYHQPTHINVGTSEELSILEVARLVASTVGFKGKIVHDLSKPDGTPRKKSDLSQLTALGWQPKIRLREGLPLAFQDFLKQAR